MYVVDASALVAIVIGEPERDYFLDVIKKSPGCITHVVSVIESAMAFSNRTGSNAAAMLEIMAFLKEMNITIVASDSAILVETAIARDRYGKGSGHRASLNLGDCVTYGVAKVMGMRILYKGEDFKFTDMA